METKTNHPAQALDALELAAGGAMSVMQMQRIWRVASGALRMGNVNDNGDVDLVSIALPGDLVGVEYWAGDRVALHASAIVPTRLIAVDVVGVPLEVVLREALLTARQRCMEIVAVRTGPVAERVRALLLLLSRTMGSLPGKALPSIKETAELVGSTPETVSRVLSHLKQLHLLADRRRGKGAVDLAQLRDARFSEGMTSSGVRFA